MADVKDDTCILTKNINLAVIIGDLILPDRTVLAQVFGEENLPRMTQEENQLLKQHSKWLSDKQNIYEAVGLSISSNEHINVFLNKINKNNWESVFYTALCSKFGIKITNKIKYKNPDFFSDIIKNNFHSRRGVLIEKQKVRKTRGMLLLLYKCKISNNCYLQPRMSGDVMNEICSYIPKYVLREWIDKNELDFDNLCQNTSPGAIDMIKEIYVKNPNSKYITWYKLCENPSAVKLIEKEYIRNPNSENIEWKYLCENPEAVYLIEEELKRNPNSNKIDWVYLCLNPKAMHLIEKIYKKNPNSKKIYWWSLFRNPSPIAIRIIEEELNKNSIEDQTAWKYLCENPEAIHLIEKELKEHPDSKKIDWRYLCRNPKAIHLIEKELKEHPDSERIDWESLCENPEAIHLIEEELGENLDSIRINDRCWEFLCRNPSAVNLIEKEYKKNQNSERINWESLCENPYAIRILEEELNRKQNSERVFQASLCLNPNAIHLIEKMEKNEIDWDFLSQNPSIFEPVFNSRAYRLLSQF